MKCLSNVHVAMSSLQWPAARVSSQGRTWLFLELRATRGILRLQQGRSMESQGCFKNTGRLQTYCLSISPWWLPESLVHSHFHHQRPFLKLFFLQTCFRKDCLIKIYLFSNFSAPLQEYFNREILKFPLCVT